MFFVVVVLFLYFPFHISLIWTISSEVNTLKNTIERKILTRILFTLFMFPGLLEPGKDTIMTYSLFLANYEEVARKKIAHILTSLSQLVLLFCVAWILISVTGRRTKCNTMKKKFNWGKTSLDGFKPP